MAVEGRGVVFGEVVAQSATVVGACGGQGSGDGGVGLQGEVVVEFSAIGVVVGGCVGELVAGHADGGAGACAGGHKGGGVDLGVSWALHQGAELAAGDRDASGSKVGAELAEGEGDDAFLARHERGQVAGDLHRGGGGVDGEGGDVDGQGDAVAGDVEHRVVGAVGQLVSVWDLGGPVAVGVDGGGVGFAVEGERGGGTDRDFAAQLRGVVLGEVVYFFIDAAVGVGVQYAGDVADDQGVVGVGTVFVEVARCIAELVAGYADGGVGAGVGVGVSGGVDQGVGGALHQWAEDATGDLDVVAAEVGAGLAQGKGDGGDGVGGQHRDVAGDFDGGGRGVGDHGCGCFGAAATAQAQQAERTPQGADAGRCNGCAVGEHFVAAQGLCDGDAFVAEQGNEAAVGGVFSEVFVEAAVFGFANDGVVVVADDAVVVLDDDVSLFVGFEHDVQVFAHTLGFDVVRGQVVGLVHFNHLVLHARFGFEDQWATALACALLGQVCLSGFVFAGADEYFELLGHGVFLNRWA